MGLLNARIGIVGAGAVGTALGLSLAEHGLNVVAAWSRTGERARWLGERIPGCRAATSPGAVADQADAVFITTPDRAIAAVTAAVRWRSGHTVIHCSGGLTTAALTSAAEAGALVGSLHPIQSFASRLGSSRSLNGIWFGVEAEEPLRTEILALVERLGGKAVVLRPEDKPLYHAAAVFASNYLVALVSVATGIWQRFGLDQAAATEALLPIVRGTLDNLSSLGLPNCLTGPIARGDVDAVERQLAALDAAWPASGNLYRYLGRLTVPLGRAKGTLGEDEARQLLNLLRSAGDSSIVQTLSGDHEEADARSC